MKRKLFVANQCSGYLVIDTVNAFVKSGKYDEVVLAVGNDIPPTLNLDPKVKLQKICKYNNKTFRSRAITWLKGTFQILMLLWFKYRKYDLFLYSNPTTISFISFFLRRHYSVMVYDIFPEAILKTGVLTEKSFFYQLWCKANKCYYRKAKHIYTLTDGMAQEISKYCTKEKIKVVPLWADSSIPVKKLSNKDNPFRQKYGLTSKFLVMYSGNIGRGHDLECMAEVAKELRDIKEICILFVGEGYAKKGLEEKAKAYGIEDTLKFIPFQPHEMLSYSLSTPDLALVSTNREGGGHGIPSKTFNLIRMGRPIVCIAEPHSSIARFVSENHVGTSFRYNEVHEFANFIMRMYQNRSDLAKYEENLRICASKYTKKIVDNIIV